MNTTVRPSGRARAGRNHVVLAAALALLAALVLGAQPSAAHQASTALNTRPDATWQTNGTVHATAYYGNVVYLAGEFTQVRPPNNDGNAVARNHAAAFDATTGGLLPWNPNVNAAVRALSVSSDGGTVYLGGRFTSVGGQPRNRIAAVDAVAGKPTAWRANPAGTVSALALSPDGSLIYLGGSFSAVNGTARTKLAAINTVTGALASFAPEIDYPEKPWRPNVRSLAVSPDGASLYVGGVFETVNGQPRRSLAKVDRTTGSVLPWDADIAKKLNKYEAQVYAIAPSGTRVFICGDFYRVRGVVRPNLAGVDDTRGALLPGWDTATDGAINDCAVSATHLYVGGHFDYMKPNGEHRRHIASINIASGAVSGWNPGANSIPGVYVFGVHVNRLAVGGAFTQIGGRPQQGFAQFSGTP